MRKVLLIRHAKSIGGRNDKHLYPPEESIWVTHGILIAAIAEVLGIDKDIVFVPQMASITEIEI